MARLTPAQVRVRVVLLLVLVVTAFALLILGMAYAGGSDWFFLFILFFDVPAIAILYVVEWAQRARA